MSGFFRGPTAAFQWRLAVGKRSADYCLVLQCNSLTDKQVCSIKLLEKVQNYCKTTKRKKNAQCLSVNSRSCLKNVIERMFYVLICFRVSYCFMTLFYNLFAFSPHFHLTAGTFFLTRNVKYVFTLFLFFSIVTNLSFDCFWSGH